MNLVSQLLSDFGPMRSSRLSELLRKKTGISAEAARKRLSRARAPIRSFPFSLLPKREAFFYLEPDRTTERFWTSFHDVLRETDSVYGTAIDGLLARGGIVSVDEFAVISGAPNMQIKQVPVSKVLERLREAGFVFQVQSTDANSGDTVEIARNEIGHPDRKGMETRNLVESVMLDGLREWARKNGLASYNSIAIRGESHPRLVGPYKWDLTGPSYLLPLREGGASPSGQGFLVADVFASTLTDYHIRYAIKKATNLRATTKVGRVLPMVFAQGFTSEALTLGHKSGLLLATPETLFGSRVASSLKNLSETLANAAAVVATNPDRLAELLENLTEIEGAAGNLRGILFELMVAFLVRRDGSIDMGIKASNPQTGQVADIDVLLVKGRHHVVTYECKGKSPGVYVTLTEVEEWLRRLPTFKAHIKSQPSLTGADIRFEFWTSGEFEPEALDKLKRERITRTKNPIAWMSGAQVRELSCGIRETAVTKAINEHFFKHPLAKVSEEMAKHPSQSLTVAVNLPADPTPLKISPPISGKG